MPEWPTLTVTLHADGSGRLELSASSVEEIDTHSLEDARALVLARVAEYANTHHHRPVRLRVREPEGEWLLGVHPDGAGFELPDDASAASEAREPRARADEPPAAADPPRAPLRRVTVTDSDAGVEPLAPPVRITTPSEVPPADPQRLTSPALATSIVRPCMRVRPAR